MNAFDPSLIQKGNVTIRGGNGWSSLGDKTYDVIHVGAAAASVPPELIKG
jgi:protein-L-isoaspartate O-methyltransferase